MMCSMGIGSGSVYRMDNCGKRGVGLMGEAREGRGRAAGESVGGGRQELAKRRMKRGKRKKNQRNNGIRWR